MSSRNHVSQGGAGQSAGYSKLDDHRKRDERTYLMRSLLFGALTVTGVLYGLAVYFGITAAERAYAGKEFKALATQAGQDIRKSFAQSATALSFLAERYATNFPDDNEWPTVLIPGFDKDMGLLRDISGFEMLVFLPLVRFEDINRTERFLMNAWAADPLIPAGAGAFGIYGVNESAGRVPYKDTTKVVWDAQYEVVLPIAQMNFDRAVPPKMLGRDVHATSNFGFQLEDLIRCTGASNYSYARDNCGRVSRLDYLLGNKFYTEPTVTSSFGVPIMLGQNSSRLVGVVAGNFRWGNFIGALFPNQYSGIDIVLRTMREVVTFRLDKGQAVFHSFEDTHGDRYKEFKYVHVVISGSDTYTLEFYPQQEFMDERTTHFALVLSVGAGLLILLCTLLFMLYDAPMRKDAVRTEFVLETKRRFVRFVSHEIRTPLNTVSMGLTLFDLELDTVRDAVVKMLWPGEEQGQEQSQGSGAPPSAVEFVQKFLLAKIDELKSIARDVTTSTGEAVNVLNDLLNYDKIELGIFVLEFDFVAVGDVLQRSMAVFLLQARDKNVALTLRTIADDEAQVGEVGDSSGAGAESSAELLESGMSGGLELDPRYKLIGDGSRLGQVLRNLLSNAMKFTDAGGTVAVTVQRVAGGMPEQVRIALPEERSGLLAYPRAGSVLINLVDSGAGLSEQQVQDIGKEGLQFNVSTLQGGGGSGLGLFISKGLVEQHGGQMTVTSPGLGLGVSTTLEFPLFDTLEPPDNHVHSDGSGAEHAEFPQPNADTGPDERSPRLGLSPTASPSASASASSAPGNLHMLVVDDAVSNRKLLMRIFRLKGFLCEEAYDGQDALHKYAHMCAQNTPPCAILMDYEMPVLNGPSATRLLREQGCSCFIFGVTGNVMQKDIEFFISCGADAVFAKPLNAESVMKLITRISTPRGGREEIAASHDSASDRTSVNTSVTTFSKSNTYSFAGSSNRVAPSPSDGDASALRPSEGTAAPPTD